jgi:pimeloyl-ACP methyl ester carboxylesterase
MSLSTFTQAQRRALVENCSNRSYVGRGSGNDRCLWPLRCRILGRILLPILAVCRVDAETKIACPVLSLWGADFEAVGKMFDMTAVWTEMADDLRAEAIEQCGHLPHEEQPEKVNGLLVEFLESWRG